MATAVIEFDSLPDAVGAAAENHDLGYGVGIGFALGFVAGIKVRSEAFELGGTGIDTIEDGGDAQLFAAGAHFDLRNVPELGEFGIRDAAAFGAGEAFARGVGKSDLAGFAFNLDDFA